MIEIHTITNSVLASKTYILYRKVDDIVWLVDIGDVEPVFSFLKLNALRVAGVFITHAHFDHFYGLAALVERYPESKVYCTSYSKEALASEKLNLSKYFGSPISYDGNNVVTVHEGCEMVLFDGEPKMKVLETPGHNPGCLTMLVGKMVFTGDAYIPGVRVNTGLPFANREQARESLMRIREMAIGRIVYSGH